MKLRLAALAGIFCLLLPLVAQARETCAICGKVIEGTVSTWGDHITGEKKLICPQCSQLSTVCYLCGLPVLKNFKTASDGRVVCERDARSVIFDDEEALSLCRETREAMEGQFSRFLTFPDTNVTTAFMDRVHIQELYKFAGNDYVCPNMWGCTQYRTNTGTTQYRISLLSGLPSDLLQSTYVHEHTHVWLAENLPPPRARQIGPDALEGFCELVAYRYAEAKHLDGACSNILGNFYTRGQIQLLLEADQRFGFNEVLDWMKYGRDPLLVADAVDRVRDVELPAKASPAAAAPLPIPAGGLVQRGFDRLTLQGITWSKTRPMALINDRTFEPKDVAKVTLGGVPVKVSCLTITEDTVVMQVAGEAQPQTLKLPNP